MDHLWSPWRFRYVTEAAKSEGCVFCEMAALPPARDRERFILHRARFNFVVLNLYPYTTAHCMVVPYAHLADLADVPDETQAELHVLARRTHAAIKAAYHPEGFNLGMNLGKCAGAGVADHLHLHVLPRWTGDANFLSVVGETRVLPEDLRTTYDKLVEQFRASPVVDR